jgi:hypothetical protein
MFLGVSSTIWRGSRLGIRSWIKKQSICWTNQQTQTGWPRTQLSPQEIDLSFLPCISSQMVYEGKGNHLAEIESPTCWIRLLISQEDWSLTYLAINIWAMSNFCILLHPTTWKRNLLSSYYAFLHITTESLFQYHDMWHYCSCVHWAVHCTTAYWSPG